MAAWRHMWLNSCCWNVGRSDGNDVSTTLFKEKRLCAPYPTSFYVRNGSNCRIHLGPKTGASTEDGRAAPGPVSLDEFREQHCMSALDPAYPPTRGNEAWATVFFGLFAGQLSLYPNSHIQGPPFGLSLSYSVHRYRMRFLLSNFSV